MTDILEQARGLVMVEDCFASPCCISATKCVCRDAAAAMLELAKPGWREIDDEARDGRWILGGWYAAEVELYVVRRAHGVWIDYNENDETYEQPDLYMPILPLPPKEEQ